MKLNEIMDDRVDLMELWFRDARDIFMFIIQPLLQTAAAPYIYKLWAKSRGAAMAVAVTLYLRKIGDPAPISHAVYLLNRKMGSAERRKLERQLMKVLSEYGFTNVDINGIPEDTEFLQYAREKARQLRDERDEKDLEEYEYFLSLSPHEQGQYRKTNGEPRVVRRQYVHGTMRSTMQNPPEVMSKNDWYSA